MLTEENRDETGARLETYPKKLLVWLEQKKCFFALSAWISTKLWHLLPYKTTAVDEVYNSFVCGHVFIWLREKQQNLIFSVGWKHSVKKLICTVFGVPVKSIALFKHTLKQALCFEIKFSRFIKLPEFSDCTVMTMHCMF